MKRLIILIFAVLLAGTLSAQQSNTFKYVVNADGGLKAALGATSNVVSTADYVIDKVGSTYYARPGIGSGLTAYSGSVISTVANSCINASAGGKYAKTIFIKAGYYDNMDAVNFTHDSITIEGAGMYKTILKLKSSFDVGKTWASNPGFINLINAKYITIKNIQLDGNAANQFYQWAADNITGRIQGINGGHSGTSSNDYFVAENCYVHDFTEFGMWLEGSDDARISNCRFKDNDENNINHSKSNTNTLFENCLFEGANSVSVAISGTDNTLENCVIRGSVAAMPPWGISFEGKNIRNKAINCKIFGGTGMTEGIAGVSELGTHDLELIGCYVSGSQYGIVGSHDTNTVIRDCKIVNTTSRGILLGNPVNGIYQNITIKAPLSITGIWSDEGSSNCIFDNITIDSVRGAASSSIDLKRDSASIIRNCKLTNNLSKNLVLQGCKNMDIYSNTLINTNTRPLILMSNAGVGSVNNYIHNNRLTYVNTGSSSIVEIQDLCNNNILQNNIIGNGYGGIVPVSTVTGTQLINNYSIFYKAMLNGRDFSINGLATVKKIIGGVGVADCDFNFVTAANTTEQVITLGAIVPAGARIVSVSTYTTAVFTGATTLVAEIGTASSGADFIASASIYAANAITATAAGGVFIAAPFSTATTVYVSATPGANWSSVTAGKVTVYVTYIPYN